MEPRPFSNIVRTGLSLIRRHVRRHPWAFGIAAAGATVYGLSIIASAIVIGRVTDEVIVPILDEGADPGRLLRGAALAILAVSVVKAIGIMVRRFAAGFLQFRTRIDLRQDLLAHQLQLQMAWFNEQATGDLLSISENDSQQASAVLSPLPFGTGSAILLIVTIVMLFVTDVWLGLVAFVGIFASTAGDTYGMYRTFNEFVAVQRLRGEISTAAHESFDGALTVKALGREDLETERFAERSVRLRDRMIRVARIFGDIRSIVEALPLLTTLVLLWVGAVRVGSGDLTAGDVVTATYLMTLVALPISVIGYVVWEIASSTAAWDRVQSVMNVADFVPYGPEAARTATTGAPVDGDDVGFAYPDAEPVLHDMNVHIPEGRTVALVGPTGSGKSTVVKLLARLWDPGSGAIRLDGRDLRDFRRSALAGEMAYVAQEAFLFDDSVMANIRLGADIDDDQVRWAAELAGADRFIEALPDGYGTHIGERGTTLSGGQRQRIALARALARRPRLLVLDDATSAIDPSVEAGILQAMRASDLPSTILVVAYRPSSIALADEVIFIDEGRIVDHGSHTDLLERRPGYGRLLRAYEEDAGLDTAPTTGSGSEAEA